MAGKKHLTEVFRWSNEAEVTLAEALASGLGMAVPIALAAATGRLSLGFAAALGALSVAGAGARDGAKARLQAIGAALAPAAAGALAASLAVSQGSVADATLVALSGVAALIGGYDRTLALAATRFVLFLWIGTGVAGTVPHAAALLLLVVAGGVWTSMLIVLLGALVRARRRVDARRQTATAPRATAAQKLARWRRSLAHIAGWQYTLRLLSCLVIAVLLRSQWPEHHLYWIAVTVAILTRRLEPVPVRTTQRALGTALGVVVAGLLVAAEIPLWAQIFAIGLLAAARPLTKARNYLVYSAIMTPLIILILDAGKPSGSAILVDRLVATLAGTALVIATTVIFQMLAKATGNGGAANDDT